MHLSTKRNLTSFMELSYFTSDESDIINQFYSNLETKDEMLVANPENMKKIIDFFNCEDNRNGISQSLLKDDGLLKFSSNDTVFVDDFVLNSEYIHTIKLHHCLKVNENIESFIKKSQQEFFNYLVSFGKEGVYSHSLRKPDRITIESLTFKNDRLSVGLSESYIMKDYDESHFDRYKKDNYYFSGNRMSSGELRIYVRKFYHYNTTEKDLTNE